MGRLTLKAALLFPLVWINCDDQGRISGDPDEVKYVVCPNIDHIAKTEIPELLKELEAQGFVKVYATSKTKAMQMLDWWEEEHNLQWAYPSRYPPPEGWTDHLRYHPTPKEIITENWPPPERLGKELARTQQSPAARVLGEELGSPLRSDKERTKEIIEKEQGEGEGEEKGEGRLPSALGSRAPPSSVGLSKNKNEISNKLVEAFRMEWGRVLPARPNEIIPREPGGKELAQLRDLAEDLITMGGCPLSYIREAFREAAAQGTKSKMSVSYVRAILLDWLAVPRSRSP